MKFTKKITFPTYLTLLRLVAGPFFVPYLIVHYTSCNDFIINIFIAALFLLLCFTDYLDGFIARRYKLETKLGATLDHLADKFLTCSAFIALVAVHKLSYLCAIIFIGREFFMMGLREVALESNMKVKVSSWGKIKTALHCILITWMILNPIAYDVSSWCSQIEFVLLAGSLLVSIGSAAHYFVIFYSQLKSR